MIAVLPCCNEADMDTHEKRKAERVEFSHRFEAQMMSIDGTATQARPRRSITLPAG